MLEIRDNKVYLVHSVLFSCSSLWAQEVFTPVIPVDYSPVCHSVSVSLCPVHTQWQIGILSHPVLMVPRGLDYDVVTPVVVVTQSRPACIHYYQQIIQSRVIIFLHVALIIIENMKKGQIKWDFFLFLQWLWDHLKSILSRWFMFGHFNGHLK